jgi:hypothetical protein
MVKYLYKVLSNLLTAYDMKINHCRNARVCQRIIELDVASQ